MTRLFLTRIAFAVAVAAGAAYVFHATSTVAAASYIDTGLAKPTAFLPEFGLRDARTCNRLTTKPTIAQIPTLIQCAKDNHASRDFISIWEDISVETGSMRPYNYNRDHHYTGIDTTSQLLPIRGTMTQVACSSISRMRPSNEGKNCNITVMPTAQGDCFKTSFGDWSCDMEDFHPKPMQQGMPPPPSR